jgi:hypothetical protein
MTIRLSRAYYNRDWKMQSLPQSFTAETQRSAECAEFIKGEENNCRDAERRGVRRVFKGGRKQPQ